MRRSLIFAIFLFAFAGAASAAQAEVVQYMSRHPLPKRVGHGFCDIDVPHFHDYPPSDPRLYRQVDGQYYFVGDPTPFGYEGPRYSFYGPHPIADTSVQLGGPTYCYLQGPHYHWYAPPPQAQFEMRGGAYWFTGAFDPVFYSDQPRFVVVNDVYAPMVYERPIIDVAIAPPAFHAEFLVGGGPGWRYAPGWRENPGWRGPGPGPGWRGPGSGPGWRGPGPGPGWHGPERREVVMREHREGVRGVEEHRNWERQQRGPGWRGGPPGREPGGPHGGWHGGPPPGREPGGPHGGWHAGGSAPPANGGGWHGGGAPPANGGAPHGGGGGQHPGGHGNGFHR
jgi:hypothetical protein